MLEHYEEVGKQGRPVFNASDAVQVDFGLSLQNIMKVDWSSGTITTLVWYNMEWKDEVLTWNPAESSGITSIHVSPDDIYTPDIMPYNGVPGWKMMKTDVIVHSNGKCHWVPTVELTTTCAMPWDGRELFCDLKFGSWTYDGLKLNLTNSMNTIDLSTFNENSNWSLEGTDVERHVVQYACCPEPYIDVTFSMHLQRKRRQILRGRGV